jgi:hypothetical protein
LHCAQARGPIEPGNTRATEAPDQRLLVGLRRVSFGAVRAELAHQALREHAEQARGKQVRLDPHVGKPRHRARRVVGVQRRQHQVSGQARLHGDLRSLRVADLADHDHVRVLPQDRAQCPPERQLDPRIHLDLPTPSSAYSIGSSTS